MNTRRLLLESLTESEIELLIEALARAASRHESMARNNPRAAGPHDRKALAMRKLKGKLLIEVSRQ
jgi:hypothetical protein